MNSEVVIVGGGPAGLFCAFLLLQKNYKVKLFDQSSGVGKKFLIAGNGGLNLTHSENLEDFSSRYTHNEELFKKLIKAFSPQDLRDFCLDLGVETFVGTSGRVFPKNLKAAQILMNWLKLLKDNPNFELNTKHKLTQINEDKTLIFEFENKERKIKADKIILAMGGASWVKTGSDGKWLELLDNIGIKSNPLMPMNCGFEINWSEYIKKNLNRFPLKNIEIKIKDKSSKSEALITDYGIEGGGIYALSNFIRDEILKNSKANLLIDFKPNLKNIEIEKLYEAKASKESLSNFLRKKLNLSKEILTLLKERESNLQSLNPREFSNLIKNYPLELVNTRPIDEAISVSGGVKFDQLHNDFESKKIPGLYICGEMLDFEAPTGGYLLQACFATAYNIVKSF